MDVLDWIVGHNVVFIYFSIFLSIPSVLLYSLEIVTILRHKSFHTSFHALFVVRAVPDLLYTLDSYYGYRLPNILGTQLYPIYSQFPNWAFATFAFLTSYTFQTDNLATGFILFHRLTAVAFPMRHEKFWKKFLLVAVLIVYCMPLYTVELLTMSTTILIFSGSLTDGDVHFMIAERENGTMLPKHLKINSISSVVFLLVCSMISVATLWAYRRTQSSAVAIRQENPDGSSEPDTIQRKLFIYALLTFFGHVLSALFMIGIVYCDWAQDMTVLAVMNTQYTWIVDMGTVVLPSWLLLWAGPSFRRQLMADFLPRWICGGNGNAVSRTTRVSPLANNDGKQQQSWTAGIK